MSNVFTVARATRMFAASLLLVAVGSVDSMAQSGPPLSVSSARALDAGDRTSIMILVRNTGDRPVAVSGLRVAGRPMSEHLLPVDPKNPRSPGCGVDWFDVRPRVIPARGAGVIVLGYVVRKLREPRLELVAETDSGDVDLGVPAPQPESLKVASATFSPDLSAITLLLRNEGERIARITEVEIDGRPRDARLDVPPVAPGGLAVLTLPAKAALGAPCAVLVRSDRGTATASFRAFPAESLNYTYYGHHASRPLLAERNMDVHVNFREGHAEFGEEMDRNGGRLPEKLAQTVARRAAEFGRDPTAWAWYMQDDAGWGRPRPQTLVELGRFLRENGSPQRQVLCNPADLRRYAWTLDHYLNYAYHATGQSTDPTVFGGDRSLETIRSLNEPAPVVYLVDAVGQSSRWITPAEEDLASYAALGRGARYPGWFLASSVWEQGGSLRGGIDAVESRPWRYQEGATACVPVFTHIGNIAGLLKALQPHLAASATLPGRLLEDGIEVLPVQCRSDLLILTLLNRRLQCTYPRDYPDGSSSGGIRLKPHRRVTIEQALPAGFSAGETLAFDHDRGFRPVPIREQAGSLRIQVDAVDTATLVLVARKGLPLDPLRKAAEARLRPAPVGSSLRPDLVLKPQEVAQRGWEDPSKSYRSPISVRGPLPPGASVRAALPVEGAGLGYFDPRSVKVHAAGREHQTSVDYFRPVYRPAEGAQAWDIPKDNASIQASPEAVTIDSRRPTGYGLISLSTRLDPRYDVLEIRRQMDGQFEPILHLEGEENGKRSSRGIGLRQPFEQNVWSKSEILPASDGGLPMARIFWRKVAGAALPFSPSALRFGGQVYTGTYRFGEIRQCKSAPDVYFKLPEGLKAGETLTVHAYWNLSARPCAVTPHPAGVDGMPGAVEAHAGAAEGFRVSAVDGRGFQSEAKADAAWVEARSAEGVLVAEQPMESSDGLRWTLQDPVPVGDRVRMVVTGGQGRVVAVELAAPRAAPPLREIARVTGQVETLACSEDGRTIAAGADRVYAFESDGVLRWAASLGENRRQQDRYGPGRNVERVESRGDKVLAKTFRFNPKSQDYENAIEVTYSSDGREEQRSPWDWRKGTAPPTLPKGHAWPPYTHLPFVMKDGVLAATTQGLVQRLGAWEQRRSGRIDDAVLLEPQGLVAIAWKRNPNRYDWTTVPVLEFLSLKDGSTIARYEGIPFDDIGHFGTDLRLARGRGKVYLGDPTGRIYACEHP